MSTYQSVEIAIKEAALNKRKAQGFLFETFYSSMYRICFRYAGDEDEAKDLVQDAFIKLISKLPLYRHDGSFEGWLKRLVTNHCIDVHRKKKWEYRMPENIQIEADEQVSIENDELDMINKMKAKEAMKAIQELSPQYRMVFSLAVFEHMTHKEIAEKLGITEGTSKSNLAKAKKRLKEILESKFVVYEQL